WFDLAYGGGYFVLVGRDQPGSVIGRIASSPDGTNWTFRFPDSFTPLRGITYFRDTFITVGYGGVILQSDPLTGPIPLQLERPNLVNGVWQLTLRGDTGQVSRIEASADLSQ